MDEGRLFSNIKFVVGLCNNQQDIKNILIEWGAKHINYLSEQVTLVIADDNCPEADEAIDLYEKPVVSSLWVHLSLKAQKLLPTEAFSPTKRIFQNVIASFSLDLSKHDVEILAATLTFYGARVSKDVAHSSHFIASNAEISDLPDTPLTHTGQLKIVAPDWVLESTRLRRCCEELLYEPNLLLPKPQLEPPPSPAPKPSLPTPTPTSKPSLTTPTLAPKPSLLTPALASKPSLLTPALAPKPSLLTPALASKPSLLTPALASKPSLPTLPIVSETVDYFGHDTKYDVPKDLPLVGCKFKFIDYDYVNPKLREKWCHAIRSAGATFEENFENLTHLICENRASDLYSKAIKLKIRCVTIYWINDVLAQDRLSYPWKALHLPVPFSNDNRPLTNQLVTMTNFKGKERREVREMIIKTGAKFTDYCSPSNTIIICGNVGGEKYDRAIEWRIPIANCQIISDILLDSSKDLGQMLSQSKYQLFNRGDPLKLKSYEAVRDLMQPWTKAISAIRSEQSEEPSSLNGDSRTTPIAKEATNEESGVATCETIQTTRSPRKSNEPVRLMFTHLKPRLYDQLKLYATDLNLGFASGPTNCTHLIVDRISRTPNFICAFSHASYIVSHRWLIESHGAKNLLDEKHYILQDKEGEEKFSFSLAYSLFKRRKRTGLLFKDTIFFVTPSVRSSVPHLKEMIESAGGIMVTRKPPTKLQIDQLKSEGKRLIVVSCDHDLHLCSTMEHYSIDIVNVEFVISGILRQDIDFEAHRVKAIRTLFVRPETDTLVKKLRLDDSVR